MSKMTSDLYFTQLTEINNFSVEDKRNGNAIFDHEPDNSLFSESHLSFYALISKDEKTEKWTSIFKVVDKLNFNPETHEYHDLSDLSFEKTRKFFQTMEAIRILAWEFAIFWKANSSHGMQIQISGLNNSGKELKRLLQQ